MTTSSAADEDVVASPLFRPLTLRSGQVLQNRVGVAPMCMYSAVDGFVHPGFHQTHIGQYALHRAAIVLMEASAVVPEGRITPHCLGIWSDEHVAGLRDVVSHAHALNPKVLVGIQLAHAGRKASTNAPWCGQGHGAALAPGELVPSAVHAGVQVAGFQAVGPSAVAYDDKHQVPAELSVEEIAGLVQAFASAARRADAAGFDVVELHGAHGYLLHQFMSPLSNHRTDQYGGSLENRLRFPLEVCRAVRQAFPAHKSVLIRISASDWMPAEGQAGSWTVDQAIELCRALWTERLVDFIDVSGGGLHPLQHLPDRVPSYQVPFSQAIKEAIPGIVTSAVGRITEARQAEQIVADGRADIVLMAREFLRSPSWVLKAAHELMGKSRVPEWAPQYQRGRPWSN